MSRERTFGQRYARAFFASFSGLAGMAAIGPLEPHQALAWLVYALIVMIVLLGTGEGVYRAAIGLLAPFAFLMLLVTVMMLLFTLGVILSRSLG